MNSDIAAVPQVKESFAALLEESLGTEDGLEGNVLRGRVVNIDNDAVVVDVGLKSEGRIPLREFSKAGEDAELKIGDSVEVFLERLEDKNGEAMLSREKARREEGRNQLEQALAEARRVTGPEANSGGQG